MADNFREEITKRNVARGKQGKADLDALKATGSVGRPEGSEDISRALAREYVPAVESGRHEKRFM